MTDIGISQQGDSTYDSFVLTGIPGVEQVEVTALFDEDDAAGIAHRLAAKHLAESLRDYLAGKRTFVYIVTLPGDDHAERHVFTDHALARKVVDAVEGAHIEEQATLDEAFANFLIEQETGE